MSAHDSSLPQSARAILEIGVNREGYWNNEKFMEQMIAAVKVAEARILHVYLSMFGCLITPVVTPHLPLMHLSLPASTNDQVAISLQCLSWKKTKIGYGGWDTKRCRDDFAREGV